MRILSRSISQSRNQRTACMSSSLLQASATLSGCSLVIKNIDQLRKMFAAVVSMAFSCASLQGLQRCISSQLQVHLRHLIAILLFG